MAELIWVQEEGGLTEYVDHGRFRAWLNRNDEPSQGRTTIKYFIRDMETDTDEKASYVQIATKRADEVIASLRAKLEGELIARGGGDEDSEPQG